MSYKSPNAAVSALCNKLPSVPSNKAALDAQVAHALETTPSSSSVELRRAKWELALKSNIFDLAMKEGQALKDPETKYYDEMKHRFDVTLSFLQQDACDSSFLLQLLEDLLQSQSITSCARIFSWVEAHARALTSGMLETKLKSLVLLRTLNNLLRRLSKMGADPVFSGRILAFLSAVFPLSEKSGVNLRGEYGSMWESVDAAVERQEEEAEKAEAMKTEDGEGGEEKKEDAMEVDSSEKEEQGKKDAFYKVFWSLQLPFSRPPVFAGTLSVADFRTAVEAVLPRLKEATAHDRALAGGKASHEGSTAGTKRKRASDSPDAPGVSDYFFAKFLTSPDLLDLEIADVHFRRQVIFQLLVLLQHLDAWSPVAKAAWFNSKNRSLQMDFTLQPDDATWVSDVRTRLAGELRASVPAGGAFAETVAAVLERERNWIRWKNEGCQPFEMPIRDVGIEEETKEARKRMKADREGLKGAPRYGSAALKDLWENGFKELSQLEVMMRTDDLHVYAKTIKNQDKLTDMAKARLPPPPTDGSPAPKLPARIAAQIENAEANKLKTTWLAMRAARGTHYGMLQHAGTGDVVALEAAIDKAEADEKARAEAEDVDMKGEDDGEVKDEGGDAVDVSDGGEVKEGDEVKAEGATATSPKDVEMTESGKDEASSVKAEAGGQA
ncbi:hypothetical protein PENSPDRAFT_594388 [Peniophora sp. CONT]|nr:hypothetical protein PENSPDRAFT_594388 [Peniophora sp. CONT]